MFRSWQWPVAFAIALSLHAAGLAVMVWRQATELHQEDLRERPITVFLGTPRPEPTAQPQPQAVPAAAAALPEPAPAITAAEPQRAAAPPSAPPAQPLQPLQPLQTMGRSAQLQEVAAEPAGDGDDQGESRDVVVNPAGTPERISVLADVRAGYAAELGTWLSQHKRYPLRARQKRHEGIALLRFAVDRNGIVDHYSLEQSTGSALLDRAVLALIERAQPLPRIPDLLNQNSFEVVVPIQFQLR